MSSEENQVFLHIINHISTMNISRNLEIMSITMSEEKCILISIHHSFKIERKISIEVEEGKKAEVK